MKMVPASNQYVSRSAHFPPDIVQKTWGAIHVMPQEELYENIEKDEYIALAIGRHWKTLFMPLVFALFLLVLPLVLIGIVAAVVAISFFITYALVFSWFWYCFVLYYLIGIGLKWRSDIYILTNERMIDFNVFGLFYKDVTDTDYSAIHEVTYRTGGFLTGSMDFGDVILKTYDGEIIMKNIPMPTKVALAIGELVEASHAEHPPTPPPLTSPSA